MLQRIMSFNVMDMFHSSYSNSLSTPARVSALKGECLPAASKLYVGEYLVNHAKSGVVQIQNNGDLCTFSVTTKAYGEYPLLYQHRKAWHIRWCIGVTSTSPSHLEITSAGVMSLVSTSGEVYWQAGHHAGEHSTLILQDDMNLILFSVQSDSTGSLIPQWTCGDGLPFDFASDGQHHFDFYATPKCPVEESVENTYECSNSFVDQDTPLVKWKGDCLLMNEKMYVGDYLVNADKTRAVQLQNNGDLCIYDITTTINTFSKYFTFSASAPVANKGDWQLTWCLGAVNHDVSHLVVNDHDGTLALVDSAGNAYWQSMHAMENHENYQLSLQNDGNLVLYDSHGMPQWACGGGGPFYDSTHHCDVQASIYNHQQCLSTNSMTNESLEHGGMGNTVFAIVIIVAVVSVIFVAIGMTLRVCWHIVHNRRATARNVEIELTTGTNVAAPAAEVVEDDSLIMPIADATYTGSQAHGENSADGMQIAVVVVKRSRTTSSQLSETLGDEQKAQDTPCTNDSPSVPTEDMPVAQVYCV